MNRRFLLPVLGFCLVVLVGYCVIPREPSYKGKRCREWLAELDSAFMFNARGDAIVQKPEHKEASAAFRQMGAATLPYLIPELEAKDSRWKTNLVLLASKQPLFKFHFLPANVRRDRSVRACALLGPSAKPAIPALGFALANGTGSAVEVLKNLGPESVAVLANALTNAPGCAPPYSAARALGRFGADARIAVTNLAWVFQNHWIAPPRAAAAQALAEISRKLIEKNQAACAEVVLAKAVLIEALEGADSISCRAAAEALGLLGVHAREVIPALLKLLDSPDPSVQRAAKNALSRIEPSLVGAR